MTIQDYLLKLNTRYKAGISTEHSYRGDLQNLLETILPNDLLVTNEPTRVKCGAPDYIITKRGIPVGYIEAKDLGADLSSKAYREQFDRYRASLPNLIITNYLDFWLYRNGELVTKVSLGSPNGSSINHSIDEQPFYTALIQDFSTSVGQTITSSKKLAEMMAGKARLLATVIDNSLNSDQETEADSSLREQMEAFKTILIHDISHKEFADIYAQTIAYGMFAARLHDPSLQDFTRQEAANLIPKTNPFLRKLFQYIAGYDLDERISWIVDALADIFRATDVAALLKNFGSATQQNDPIIHFYETFLAKYDPALRKARGVWYTPEPVVNFIVRAVDDILKTEFGLKQGLADNSKTKITVQIVSKKTADKRSKITTIDTQVEVHKVQILDPACGTGTFLSEIIKHVYKKYEKQKGIWGSYMENDLIPRLNGFELLMASYAMAHLKLDLLLTETGYKPTMDQRFKVFLTNSLEEHHPDTGTLFASWLSDEANQANKIKRDAPVMVVIGNPPYNKSSRNTNDWILKLTEVYKQGLDEQSKNSLSDDYVKFIRYGQHYIEKNGQGVLAFITNNSFIDGITHRVMRKHLIDTFDKVYVLDLHGSKVLKEKSPDGSKDDNVFDIRQGVSINLFVKLPVSSSDPKLYHIDIFGRREHKYKTLWESSIETIKWRNFNPTAPYHFFSPRDQSNEVEYNSYFSVDNLFKVKGNGIMFRKDNLLVKRMYKREDVLQMLSDVNLLSPPEIYSKYGFKPTPDWKIEDKVSYFKEGDASNITEVDYRLFDKRYTYYPLDKINQIIVRGDSRKNLMQHFIKGDNIGLVVGRQGQVVGNMMWNLVFVTRTLTDRNMFYRGGGVNYPLYLYIDNPLNKSVDQVSNLCEDIVQKFEQLLGEVPDPQEVFDYCYGILHNTIYRTKYGEFLKSDFPRLPYPKSKAVYTQVAVLGKELRSCHLLESAKIDDLITSYPAFGDNKVTEIRYTNTSERTGDVWINEIQFFQNVPTVSWNLYIGGFQPAQKWLKDRKDRTLTHEEIFHYQKIIVALTETDRIMKEIDKIPFE
jgi:predicted helicase